VCGGGERLRTDDATNASSQCDVAVSTLRSSRLVCRSRNFLPHTRPLPHESK